jgi:hypothetical protein
VTIFQTPVDIARRALQHVGSETSIASLTENSRNATEISRCYDTLRQAELRRNVWRFATKRAMLRAIDTTTMLVKPKLWNANLPYPPGSIVADSTPLLWTTRTETLGQATGTGDPPWDAYYGPLTITPFDATQGYAAGEMVYKVVGVNIVRVYSALATSLSAVSEDPAVPDQWSATATYNRTQTVQYLGFFYMSLTDRNKNNIPGAYQLWNNTTTYASGATIASTVDGYVYTSVVASNIGHEPSVDDGTHWNRTQIKNPWTTAYYGGVGSNQWVYQQADTEAPSIIYPIGVGPLSQTATRNAFRLPSNFLREAPRDPRAGANAWLGAPAKLTFTDWNYEGGYLISAFSDPILYRYVADVTNVPEMDAMFCEGLACRIALAICEPLTQSTAKLTNIASEYKKFMGEARTVNGIETGPTESTEDDYITVRR